MSDLRKKTIRLAYANPDLQDKILPLISVRARAKQAGFRTASSRLAVMDLDVYGNDTDAEAFAVRLSAAMGKLGATDFCTSSGLCKGNLGLPRKDMPVIEGAHLNKFIDHLKKGWLDISEAVKRGFKAVKSWLKSGDPKEDKVTSTKKKMDVTKLKATQREINADKVQGMVDSAREGKFDPGDTVVLVSKDGYILDGHHRWAAQIVRAAEDGIKAMMKVIQVDLNVKDLLAVSNAYTDAHGIKRKSF
jgi:hypothetical protein